MSCFLGGLLVCEVSSYHFPVLEVQVSSVSTYYAYQLLVYLRGSTNLSPF